MRREVLAGIHAGHFGETKCVLRAKSSVFWPGYIDHVRNVVASCSACQENRNRNPKLPLNSAEVPTHPFQMVSPMEPGPSNEKKTVHENLSCQKNEFLSLITTLITTKSGLEDLIKMISDNSAFSFKHISSWVCSKKHLFVEEVFF